MERFCILSSFVLFGGFFCNGQMIEQIEGVLIMKNIFDQNEEILEHLKGQNEKITSLEDGLRTVVETLQGQQGRLTTIEDGLRTVVETLQGQQEKFEIVEDMQRTMMLNFQEQRAENQLCAKQDQLEDFKNTYESGTENFKASLERSSCTDKLMDFQDMLTTDECMDGSNNCSDAATCTNELMLYTCVCLSGYFGDGFTCTDVNECSESDVRCGVNEKCTNFPGSYECQCQEGYEIADGVCQDIDECQRDEHQCQSSETCFNIDGSYECQCLPPNKRNGETCELYCKSPLLFIREIGCITILHTNTSWSEAKVQCEEKGMKLLEHIERKHFDPLIRHFMPLRTSKYDVWIGFNNKRWLSSGHLVSTELTAESEGELEGDCGTFDMTGSGIGLWDLHCQSQYNALCQYIQ